MFIVRYVASLLPWLICVGLGGGFVLDRVFRAPGYHGKRSDHFWDGQFHNPSGNEPAGLGALVRWQANRNAGEWRDWIDAKPGAQPPKHVRKGALRVTFINHASMLIQMNGLNVLTDPIWSERASPVSFIGPKRHRPPGLRFEDLPPIDAVLLSHNHYDHLDLPTLHRIIATHHARIYAGLGTRALLAKHDIVEATDLDWWQRQTLGHGVTLVAAPCEHFSGRAVSDRDNTLWTSFVLESASGSVYFAGDTADGAHFKAAEKRFGRFRLAILPIGAFRPEWFMGRVHMSPAQAVRAQRLLNAKVTVASHFGTFSLADDAENEPVKALAAALENSPEPQSFWVLEPGEGRDVPAL